MITMLRRRVACKIGVATLKVKVTAWPCSKIVSAPYNLVVWSLILKLFYRNDHHNEMKCREQIWVDEGQGHSMTLQQKVSGL